MQTIRSGRTSAGLNGTSKRVLIRTLAALIGSDAPAAGAFLYRPENADLRMVVGRVLPNDGGQKIRLFGETQPHVRF